MGTGFSICVATQDPWRAAILWHHGHDSHTDHVPLSFNARKKMANYRIDWHPFHVKFYVGGGLVSVIDRSQTHIPKTPMSIKVSMFPYLSAEKLKTNENRKIEFRMHLFQMRYVKLELTEDVIILDDDYIPHSELLIIGKRSIPTKWITISLICVIGLFLLYYIYLQWVVYDFSQKAHGDYIRFDQVHDSLQIS